MKTRHFTNLLVIVLAIMISLCITGISFAVEKDDPAAGNITETTAPANDQDASGETKPAETKPAEKSVPAEKEPAEVDSVPDNGVMEVSSPTGSYTVDFYFTAEDGTKTEYHLKGGTSIMLSELFEKLGINRDTADIKETVFTDNDLVRFEKVGDDYKVISLKPFNTEESLTITFEDDEVIVLAVEDAVAPSNLGNSGGVKWEITNSGVLHIYPSNGSFGRIGGVNTYADNNNWPWKNYASQITSIKVDGVIGTMPSTRLTAMFRGLNRATTADVSGFDFTTNSTGAHEDGRGTVDSLAEMFRGCTALQTVTGADKLSSINNKRTDFMFYQCSNLTQIDGIGQLETSKLEQAQRMFSECPKLNSLDLSNWKNNEIVYNMQNMFKDSTGLTIVKMPGSDFKVRRDALLASMFENCTSLTSLTFNGMDVTKAKTMTNMFKNCSALTSLDVSSFGKLTHIINMDGFVEGCSSLETLNIDNLDNSHIGPTSNRGHSSSEPDSSITGARDFGRALFGLDENNKGKSIDSELPALKTISAKNSKVWMVHNNRGTPGNEYFNAANDSEVYYFTDKKMTYVSDEGPTEQINSNRDYIDLITDRDGTNVPTINPSQSSLPDEDKNINIKDGDLNTNGAGFLSPGVYTIGTENRSEPAEAPMCDTFYRIAYIGEVPYKVTGIDSNDQELVLVKGSQNTYINTKNMVWPDSGDKVIDRSRNPIEISYENAAIDMNGNKSDVIITVTKITFKNLERILTDPDETGTRRTHDSNNYIGSNRVYYRPILQANMSDGVQFHNYVWTGDPTEPWNKTNCLGKGSGTEIEFKIEIEGAPADTSFVFKGEDLDVAANQNWNNSDTDACYDRLPVQNAIYGLGGESFTLGSGNVMNTVRFSEHTGLTMAGNTVITTGSDPDTTWSEFTVKADAQGSNYTWTSGISCTTHALRNTKSQNAGTTKIRPEVLKELVNGTLSDDQFEFELKETSKTPDTAPSSSNKNQTKGNAANGKVTYEIMKYEPAEEDGYFPGKDPVTYTYKVKEVIPDDAKDIDGYKVKDNIIYDETEHTITVVISPPKNETEMIRGIKAEIYVDKTPGAGVTPDKTYWHHETACVDCSNGSFKNKDADKWYDKDGNEIDDPNPMSFSNIKFKNIKVEHVKVKIPAQKILKGRPWKDSDKFAAAMTLTGDHNEPMPEGTIIKDGKRYAEITIDNNDTPVKDSSDRTIGYKDTFNDITYNLEDLGGSTEKEFTYHVRELEPSETEVPAIPGVTYDAEPNNVKVTVKLDKTDPDDPKLTYKVEYTDENGTSIDVPDFTNKYDANQTIYKMEAVKDYLDQTKGEDEEIDLSGNEFEFVLKPIGDYAAIAPMPKNTSGSGANRTYTKANEDDGDIQFEVESDPEDGLVFNYQALLNAGISDNDLHSDKGVDFEYEMYEVIPDNAVNNNDGTWIYKDKDKGITYTYDGIHHTRKITVKVRTNDNETPDDPSDDFDELYIVGHKDDHKVDFYIDKDGNEKPASEIPGYDADSRHFKPDAEDLGAPIFLNYYKELPGEIKGDETYGLKNQKQTGEPKYDVYPDNPVDVSTLTLVKPDKEGATISDDGKVVTIPGEGTYTLKDDGKIEFEPEKDYIGNPTPITVKGKDTRGNDVTGTYTPHVIDPTEKKNATRTIHFTYEKKSGKKVTTDVKQTVTLTRHAAEVDPKTGEVIKWGDWSSATFPAVKNPNKKAGKGWKTSDVVPALTVNEPGSVKDVYVVYHKTGCPDCKNGTKGSSDGSSNTGDRAMPMVIGAIMLLALAAAVILIVRRRRIDS